VGAAVAAVVEYATQRASPTSHWRRLWTFSHLLLLLSLVMQELIL
jgi:multisubunit Na+/H+ antiporter MnhE subunit